MKLKYNLIMIDTTSNCNLRCPFCTNNWNNISGNKNMSKETFSKVLKLLPLSSEGFFFFSCGFEPTINPHFIDLLEMIPLEHKDKVFFTTNLTNKLSLETIERLSKININHINISVESFDKETYEFFRKNGKFEVFEENLKNITNIFAKYTDSPKLRFISMVFKQNLKDIPELIKRCNEEYNSCENELRLPFPFSYEYMDKDFAKESSVTFFEWSNLVKKLSKLSYKVKIFMPYSASFVLNNKEEEADKDIFLNIYSDGMIKLNEDIYHLNEINEPYQFFLDKLNEVQK